MSEPSTNHGIVAMGWESVHGKMKRPREVPEEFDMALKSMYYAGAQHMYTWFTKILPGLPDEVALLLRKGIPDEIAAEEKRIGEFALRAAIKLAKETRR